MRTVFKYRCRCGLVDFLEVNETSALCGGCGEVRPVSPSGVLDFLRAKTEQNAYFDAIYSAGHLTKTDVLYGDCVERYRDSVEIAEGYLKLCGWVPNDRLENLMILDVACGGGAITAGLMQHPAIHNCTFHAFDISPQGLELLARFEETLKSTNRLEMSVQNATTMVFEQACFDIIIGSSVLHHFDDVEQFLVDCRQILKPGGVMIFGEPFAVGYGIAAAVLMLAQKQLGTHYQAVDDVYKDIGYRIKSPAEGLKGLVDKHLFFQSSFLTLAQHAGFPSVKFVPLASREFYRSHFINQLLLERGISDQKLSETANQMYRTIFDIFDADNFAHSTAAFVQVVLRA